MSNIYSQLLKYAVIKKDLEEIKFCLARGADVNLRISPYNETFLHFSISEEITVELLKYGADVNARDRYGQTPLYSAIANKKDLSVIRALLCNGADINARDINGETPLHCAMIDGMELPIVRELLRNHVDVNAIDNAGKTALHLAVRWGNGMNMDVMKELMEFGADILANDHPSPLHEAVDRGYEACAKLLLKMIVLKKFDERKVTEITVQNKFDDKKVIELVHYIRFAGFDSLLVYLDKCSCEVVKMKTDKVSGNHALYDFVKKKGDTIKAFYPSNIISDEEIAVKYPIYCDIILSNLKLCSQRAILLNQLRGLQFSTRSDGGNIVVLYTDCVYKIAEFLANDHLYNLIRAFERNNYKPADNLCNAEETQKQEVEPGVATCS